MFLFFENQWDRKLLWLFLCLGWSFLLLQSSCLVTQPRKSFSSACQPSPSSWLAVLLLWQFAYAGPIISFSLTCLFSFFCFVICSCVLYSDSSSFSSRCALDWFSFRSLWLAFGPWETWRTKVFWLWSLSRESVLYRRGVLAFTNPSLFWLQISFS